MKIDRLYGITIYLLNHKKANAKELAYKFEVSQRTIQRDIETLCRAGIPISSIFGVGGGYEIIDTFKLNAHIVQNYDYSFIVTALKGLSSAYGNPKITNTIEKIKTLYRDCNSESNIDLDFSVLKENEVICEKLKILHNAIVKKHRVGFIYTNAKNTQSMKEVEPVGLAYKWYNWYLVAYSLKEEEYRLYKIVRMEQIQIKEEMFFSEHESLDTLLIRLNENDKRKYVDIKLLCKSDIRVKVLEYLNGDIQKEFENGDFIINLHVPENEHFWLSTILGLGDKIKVLEPEEIKDKICDICREILLQYKNI